MNNKMILTRTLWAMFFAALLTYIVLGIVKYGVLEMLRNGNKGIIVQKELSVSDKFIAYKIRYPLNLQSGYFSETNIFYKPSLENIYESGMTIFELKDAEYVHKRRLKFFKPLPTDLKIFSDDPASHVVYYSSYNEDKRTVILLAEYFGKHYMFTFFEPKSSKDINAIIEAALKIFV